MTKWDSVPLKQLARWLSGGTPKTSIVEYWGGEIPWISAASLHHFYIHSSERNVTKLGAANGTRLVPKGTTIFVVRGMSLMSEFRVGIAQTEVAFGQDCKALIPHDHVDPYFLAYAVRAQAPTILQNVEAAGHGTGRLPTDRIAKLAIPIPPDLREQRDTTRILRLLDDKIAVNEQNAATATALALARGHESLARIGPELVSLGEYAAITKGTSYRSADLSRGDDWLVTLKCVGRDGLFKAGGVKRFGGEYKATQMVEHGDIVVAQTDLTQRAEVIGKPIRVDGLDREGRLVASLDLVIIRPGPTLSREFLLALLTTQDFRDHAISYCNGTTVLHMGARALPDYRFPMPSTEVANSVTAIMAPLLARSDSARQENRIITDLRDILLPRLMSGAIRVREAERIVEDAT